MTLNSSMNKPWPCDLVQKSHEEFGELSLELSKFRKIDTFFDTFFLYKAYNVADEKFQRNYLS